MPAPHPNPTHEAPTRRAVLIGLLLGAAFLLAAAAAIWQVSHAGASAGSPARAASTIGGPR